MAAKQYDQGVCGHSNRFLMQEFVIFCVGNDVAREQAFRAWSADRDIWYKPLMGMYKGVAERSFLMTKADFDERRIWSLWCVQEESILIIGVPNSRGACKASLHFTKDGAATDLGMFIACQKSTALSNPVGWTYDPASDQYFVCGK